LLGDVGTLSWEDASRKCWDNLQFEFPGGESNQAAQARGVAVIKRLICMYSGKSLVVASHGTLLALILNAYDRKHGYEFWRRLSMPDVYLLSFDRLGVLVRVERLWGAKGS